MFKRKETSLVLHVNLKYLCCRHPSRNFYYASGGERFRMKKSLSELLIYSQVIAEAVVEKGRIYRVRGEDQRHNCGLPASQVHLEEEELEEMPRKNV